MNDNLTKQEESLKKSIKKSRDLRQTGSGNACGQHQPRVDKREISVQTSVPLPPPPPAPEPPRPPPPKSINIPIQRASEVNNKDKDRIGKKVAINPAPSFIDDLTSFDEAWVRDERIYLVRHRNQSGSGGGRKKSALKKRSRNPSNINKRASSNTTASTASTLTTTTSTEMSSGDDVSLNGEMKNGGGGDDEVQESSGSFYLNRSRPSSRLSNYTPYHYRGTRQSHRFENMPQVDFDVLY